jgi:hypothetical protein
VKQHFVFAALILVGFLVVNPAGTKAQEKVTIPASTVIPARLASQLDSGDVHVGDLVTMDVLEDLRISGELVIPHGARVMGHVTEAKGARKMGRGGKLVVVFETVTAGDGTKVPVTAEQMAKGKGGYGGGSLVGAGAAGLFFPPAGALLLLKHGHASVIPVGTVIAVHVTEDTPVFAIQGSVAVVKANSSQTATVSTTTAAGTPLQGTTASDTPVESVADAARRAKAEREARKVKPQR